MIFYTVYQLDEGLELRQSESIPDSMTKALCDLVLSVFQYPICGSNSTDEVLHFNYSIM